MLWIFGKRASNSSPILAMKVFFRLYECKAVSRPRRAHNAFVTPALV